MTGYKITAGIIVAIDILGSPTNFKTESVCNTVQSAVISKEISTLFPA